jgi:prepilin-type N-terminal cleavage/methylation domain-containing protein
MPASLDQISLAVIIKAVMKINKSSNAGFTIIELVVVIIIICILGLFVSLAYDGVQAKNRNAERQADIDKLKSQLESYYAETNFYPTLDTLNNENWRTQTLKNITQANLQDPSWSTAIEACTANGKATATATPTTDCYSYQVTGSDGSACNNTTIACAHYTLTASLEGGQKYVKSSLN